MKGKGYANGKLSRLITALLLSIMMTVTFVPTYAFAGTADQTDDGTQVEQNDDLQSGDDQDEVVKEPAAGDENAVGETVTEAPVTKGGVNVKGGEDDPDEPEDPEDPEPDDPDEPNPGDDEEINLVLTVPNTELKINEPLEYRAEASEQVFLLKVFFDVENPDGSAFDSLNTDSIDSYDQDYSYGTEGTYKVKAVAYTYLDGDYAVVAESEEIEVVVTKDGKVGDFSITSLSGEGEGLERTVTIGDTVTIECDAAEGADLYWLEMYMWDEAAEEYYLYENDETIESGNNAISFNTMRIQPGRYQIFVKAEGVGYECNSSGNYCVLTVDDMQLEDGEVFLEVSDTDVFINQEFDVKAYCPGADKIVVYMDEEDTVSNSGSSVLDSFAFSRPGEYHVYAVAYEYNSDEDDYVPIAYSSDEEEDQIFITAESKGTLELEMPELPQYIIKGTEDPLTFTVAKPEDADGIKVSVDYSHDGFDKSLFSEDTDEETLEVVAPINELGAGGIIGVSIEAYGIGYYSAERYSSIPVIGPLSDDVTITTTAEDNQVLINEEFGVKIETDEDTEITGVQLFDGYSLGDEEEPDADCTYSRKLSFYNSGTFTIFANVQLGEESDYWVSCEPVTITATSNGQVGTFEITAVNEHPLDDEAVAVTRGSTIKIDCSEADNADCYWADVSRYDNEENEWSNIISSDNSDDAAIYIDTTALQPGSYKVEAAAQGKGYETNQADNSFNMEVSEMELPEGKDMLLEVDKQNLLVHEEFEITVVCPGAEWIVVQPDESESMWTSREEGDYFNRCLGYSEAGTYTLRATGYKNDPDTKESVVVGEESITMTVTSYGPLNIVMPDLPQFIVAGEDNTLSFMATKPEHAEWFAVDVSYEYGDDDSGSLLSKTSRKGTIVAEVDVSELPEGAFVSVEIDAWPAYEGYERTWKDITIPVIGATDDDVTIKTTAEDNQVLVNEQFGVTVEAAGDAEIALVQLFDGDRFRDEEEPDGNGKYSRELRFGYPGDYLVFARVLLEDEDDWISCKPITIKATSLGNVGEFDIINVDNKPIDDDTEITAARGDIITVECNDAENADYYCFDVYSDDEESGETIWYDDCGESETSTINLDTAALAPGTYHVSVKASGVGYEEQWSENGFELVVEDADLPPGEMTFRVSKQELATGEEFEFTAACTGADFITVYPDYDNNKGWNRSNGGDYYHDWDSYGDSGTYNLHAIAYKNVEGQEEPKVLAQASITMTVTSKGSLEIVMPELPEYIVEGEADTLSFTAVKPENSDGFKVEVWYDYEGDSEDLVDDETENNELPIEADITGVPAGATIVVRIRAWGAGYDYTDQEARIPVIAPTSDDVTIKANKYEALVNEDVEVTVTAKNAKIDNAKLYGDGDYWFGRELRPEEDGVFKDYVSFDKVGNHTVYVEVHLEGDTEDEWLTCEPITITTTASGEVGNFAITDVSGEGEGLDRTVKQGEFVTITCSESTNADHYWVDLEKYNEAWEDWEWYDHFADADQPTISLATAEVEPGTYRVKAGANALGCENKFSTNTFLLTITERAEGELSFEVSKTEVLTCEEFTFSAICPGADRIIVYMDYENDPEWIWEEDGDWISETENYGNSGTYKLVAEAYVDNQEEPIATDEKTVTATTVVPDANLDLQIPDLPESVCEGGKDLSFTLAKPAHADFVFIRVFDFDAGDAPIYENGTEGEALNVNIPASKFTTGHELRLLIIARGLGYEEAADRVVIPVVSHTLSKVGAQAKTCTEDGNIEHWKCENCGMRFSDAAGSKVIEDDSWLLPAGHNWEKKTDPAGMYKYGRTYEECSECHSVRNEVAIVEGTAPSFVKKMKVKKGKGNITVKWKKQSKKNLKKFKGYEIRYSTNANMSGAKTVKAGKKAKTKKIKKLKKKTVYYVQMRSYSVVKGKTYYSNWTTKKVKTK